MSKQPCHEARTHATSLQMSITSNAQYDGDAYD